MLRAVAPNGQHTIAIDGEVVTVHAAYAGLRVTVRELPDGTIGVDVDPDGDTLELLVPALSHGSSAVRLRLNTISK